MERRFEEIEHTADLAIRVWGHDLAELFTNAAYGLACQLADPAGIECTVERSIGLEAYDLETLLVAWLGELLYLNERDALIFTAFDMRELSPTQLRAVARGGVTARQHGHIKAVTFNDLKIVPTDEGYQATIVFDV